LHLTYRLVVEANNLVNNDLQANWRQCRDELFTMMRVNQDLVGHATRGVHQAASLNKLTALGVLVMTSALALFCGRLLYRSVSVPLDATLAAMRELGQGSLSGRRQLHRSDEFDATEYGFNNMVGSLRSLVAQAQRSAVRLCSWISEIAATAWQQEVTVTETAASTAQIGVTFDEIATPSRELVRTMGEVSAKAEQTAHFANSGQYGLLRISEVMRQLSAAVDMVGDRLVLLSERRTRDIQATLAKGNLGMGRFSEEVQRGNAEMMQLSALLQQIIQQIQALVPRIQSVSEGIRAQSVGAEQISLALVQLAQSSRQTAQVLPMRTRRSSRWTRWRRACARACPASPSERLLRIEPLCPF